MPLVLGQSWDVLRILEYIFKGSSCLLKSPLYYRGVLAKKSPLYTTVDCRTPWDFLGYVVAVLDITPIREGVAMLD